MGSPRTMTFFAADRHLRKHSTAKAPVASGNWIRPTAMTSHTSRQNRPTEAEISELVSGGQFPSHWLCIEGKRCFKKIIISLRDPSNHRGTRAYDPLQLMFFTEEFLSCRIYRRFTLI